METLASLKLKIDSSEAAPAEMGLDKLTAAGAKAEGQMKQTASATSTLAKEEGRAASASDTLAKTMRDQEEALRRTMASAAGLSAAHAKVAAAGKVTTTEMLNLSRQMADVGVSAAMGMSPLMILIQQGPQIADVFATASARGLGFSAVLKEVAVAGWAAVAPLAPFIAIAAALAAVLGGGLLVATHQINKENKDFANTLGLTHDQLEKVKNKSVTVGDVLSGTFNHAASSLKEAFAPQLKWLSETFEKAMDGLAKAMNWYITHIVGNLSAMIAVIGKIFTTLPQIAGDAVISAANAIISGVQMAVNGAIGVINKMVSGTNELLGRSGLKFQLPGLDPVNIAKFQNPFAGAMRAVAVAGGKAFDQGIASSSKWLGENDKFILDAAGKRIKAEAGKDKSSRDRSRADTEGPVNNYAQQLAALEGQLAQAKAAELQAQLATTKEIGARLAIEHQIGVYALAQKEAALDKQLIAIREDKAMSKAEKDRLSAQVEEIRGIEERTAGIKRNAETEKATEALRREQLAINTAQLQSQVDVLGSLANVARFDFQRAEIGREIVKLQFQIQGAALQDVIASKAATDAEKQIAQARLDALKIIEANQPKVSEFEKRLNEVTEVTGRVKGSLEALANALKDHDWTGVLNAAFQAIKDLKEAFGKNGTLGSKIGAVAGVADAVGQSIGGKAGGALSGAASAGASAFMATGNPVIAAVAAVIGGISGYGKAKKAEDQAKVAAYQKEAERLAQIEAQRRDLEIQLMEASGDAAGALAARRQDELNAMDESNRALAKQIYALQDAKAAQEKLAAAVAAANSVVVTAQDNLIAAYNNQAGAIKAVKTAFEAFSASLKKFKESLTTGPLAALSPEDAYRAAKSQFETTKKAALGGDQTAISNLQSVSEAFLAASKNYNASTANYFNDLDAVKAAVDQVSAFADNQASAADAQLQALNDQLDILDGVRDGIVKLGDKTLVLIDGIYQVRDSVLTIPQALAALQNAMASLAAAQNAAANPSTPANDNSSKAANWASYLSHYSDVAAEYQRNASDAKGVAELSKLGIKSATDFAAWHYKTYGQAEGRTPYAMGGIIENPTPIGRSGIAGEAGEEAIMPLTRTSKGLGVRVSAANDDGETKALLRQLLNEMRASNTMGTAVATATLDKLDSLIDKTQAQTRAVRAQ